VVSGKVYVGIAERAKQTRPLVRSPFESKGTTVIEWSIHYFFEERLLDSALFRSACRSSARQWLPRIGTRPSVVTVVGELASRKGAEAYARSPPSSAGASSPRRAAFDAADKQFTGEHLTLRKGAMVIRDNLQEQAAK
jgi:hypothetical protein